MSLYSSQTFTYKLITLICNHLSFTMQHNEFNPQTFLPSVHVLQKAHLSHDTRLQK